MALQVAEQMADYLTTGGVTNALNVPSLSAEEAPKLKPYMALAEKLGSLVGQLTPSAVARISIHTEGAAADLNAKPIVAAVLCGFLRVQSDTVNMVNAPFLAKERGLEVRDVRTEKAGDYHTLIRVSVKTEAGERSVAGTLFSNAEPRLVELFGIKVEAELAGDMMYIVNEDAPGFIGRIGTLLGENAINIGTFNLGRREAGGFASSWRDLMAQPQMRRFLWTLGLGTFAFNMQDIVLEPYAAEILKLDVGATSALTALSAGGALLAFLLSARWLSGGLHACRGASRSGLDVPHRRGPDRFQRRFVFGGHAGHGHGHGAGRQSAGPFGWSGHRHLGRGASHQRRRGHGAGRGFARRRVGAGHVRGFGRGVGHAHHRLQLRLSPGNVFVVCCAGGPGAHAACEPLGRTGRAPPNRHPPTLWPGATAGLMHRFFEGDSHGNRRNHTVHRCGPNRFVHVLGILCGADLLPLA